MRILHTSDWHIGKRLEGVSLLEDQAETLEGFVALAADLKPDVVVIAGDLYDRSVPPHDAVTLLDDVLQRLVLGLGLPVVAIAGNHDSAERLGFASRLLESSGLWLAGDPLDGRHLTLHDAHGAVDIVPLPFATPEALRSALTERDEAAELQGFAAAMERQVQHALAALEPGRRRVAVAHAFVRGGAPSESERALQIGGTGDVPASVFDAFDYVALGHLHRPQQIDAERRGDAVRYSGSLLPYSFSEAEHANSATLATLGAPGSLQVETHRLPQRRRLRKVSGTMAELLAQGAAEPSARQQDYIWAELLDPGLVHEAMPRLRAVYPNALKITRPRYDLGGMEASRHDHRIADPVEIFADFWEAVGHPAALDEDQREVVVDAVRAAGGEATR
ncbi:MAG: hypothetical protein RIT45_1578 [Pseudomonadota bacterium]|jgi:exonuclease SbcD